MYDLQYSDMMDDYQYECFIEDIEEAAWLKQNDKEIKDNCEKIKAAYKQRAKNPSSWNAMLKRVKAVKFIACKAKVGWNGKPSLLIGKGTTKNREGKTIITTIGSHKSRCNCDDSKYNKRKPCKHMVALANRWTK
tara:strand:+ start:922 stop:1326 length:405 start_codon:yes stop_codon:yes gene_type:complete